MKNKLLYFFIISLFLLISCEKKANSQQKNIKNKQKTSRIIPAAEQLDLYLPLLKNKKIALVVNQSSLIKNTHLVDTLISQGIDIKEIFAPEHGFRGNIERGITFSNSIDSATGIKIISLLGKHKAPTKEDLKNIDLVVYDLQDVGVRFYTYISTMYYVMLSCAKNGVKMMILDRPDPNGDYVAGPVLDTSKYRSFVGILPLPIVYGMTPAELALMINGENWLTDSLKCNLQIIKIANYTHKSKYILPVKPSPSLTNYQSIRLYPSLCFFEATDFSVGRGTNFPFQVIGFPDKRFGDFTFIPHDITNVQTNPIQKDKKCYGIDLRNIEPPKFTWKYVIKFYHLCNSDIVFFTRPHWFDMLAGTDTIRKMIIQGKTENEIINSYQNDLEKFKKKRKKYLIYP